MADRPTEIRVFISSTFRDMQAERELLVKKVFPKLRHVCRARGVEFTEVDLRWGISEEAQKKGRVVIICLDEIERCRPFFIGLLGERYGWVPDAASLDPAHAPSDAPLQKGKSLTELEILYGGLRNQKAEGSVFFYFRDPALTLALGKTTDSDFVDDNPEYRSKLACLKDQIRNSDHPLLDGYGSLEEFSERIEADLRKAIEDRLPKSAPTALEQERLNHASFAATRRAVYIANSKTHELLAASRTAISAIVGPSGIGKSAILANEAQRAKDRGGTWIVEYYIGGGGENTAAAVIRYLIGEIRFRFSVPDPIPETDAELLQLFAYWLSRIPAETSTIIVIDALNQLEPEWQDLRWLPKNIPYRIRMLTSSIPGPCEEALRARGAAFVIPEPMEPETIADVAEKYLAHYRKTLSPSQLELIKGDPKCCNPLFLRTVLEEMRIFGIFERVEEVIRHYLGMPDNEALFGAVLDRLEGDYGSKIVASVLAVIAAARRGVSETELLEVTGLTRLEISQFVFGVDYQLARRAGRLGFFHGQFEASVRKRYGRAIRDMEGRLAKYFNRQPDSDRRSDELPWLLKRMKRAKELAAVLGESGVFLYLSTERIYELLDYWLYFGSKIDKVKIYGKLCLEAVNRSDRDEIFERLTYMAYLSGDMCAEQKWLLDWRLSTHARGRKPARLYLGLARMAHRSLKEAEAVRQSRLAERYADNPEEQLQGALDVAQSLAFQGRNREAERHIERIENIYGKIFEGNEKLRAYFHHQISFPYHNIDQNERFLHHNSIAKALYKKLNYVYDHCIASVNAGDAMWGAGNSIEGAREIESAYTDSSAWQISHAVNISAICLANIYASTGRYEEAKRLYKEGLAITKRIGHQWDWLYGQIYSALMRAELGGRDETSSLLSLEKASAKAGYNYLADLSVGYAAVSLLLRNKPCRKLALMSKRLFRKVASAKTPSAIAYTSSVALLLGAGTRSERADFGKKLWSSIEHMEGVKGRPGVVMSALRLLEPTTPKRRSLVEAWEKRYLDSEMLAADQVRYARLDGRQIG